MVRPGLLAGQSSLPRTSYIICGVQCKMNMLDFCLKKIFSKWWLQSINQAWAALNTGLFVTAQVLYPWSLPCPSWLKVLLMVNIQITHWNIPISFIFIVQESWSMSYSLWGLDEYLQMDCFSLRPYQVPQNEWSLFGNGSITTSSLPSSHTVYNYSPRSSYTPSGAHIQEPYQLPPPSFSSSMLSSVVLSLMHLQEVCQVLGDMQHCSILVWLHLVMVDIRSLVWAFQSFTGRWYSQPWDVGVEGPPVKKLGHCDLDFPTLGFHKVHMR